jgi:hypothetical protein
MNFVETPFPSNFQPRVTIIMKKKAVCSKSTVFASRQNQIFVGQRLQAAILYKTSIPSKRSAPFLSLFESSPALNLLANSSLYPKRHLARTMATSTALPSGALTGFADGSSYDKHRPSYPPEAVDYLLQSLGLYQQDGSRVVDLAAGTGKFTELLAARKEQFDIIAIEPHDGMRAELDQKNLNKVVSKNGFANEIPVETGWADGLICAQVSS